MTLVSRSSGWRRYSSSELCRRIRAGAFILRDFIPPLDAGTQGVTTSADCQAVYVCLGTDSADLPVVAGGDVVKTGRGHDGSRQLVSEAAGVQLVLGYNVGDRSRSEIDRDLAILNAGGSIWARGVRRRGPILPASNRDRMRTSPRICGGCSW